MTGAASFELRRCCPPVAPDDPVQGGFVEATGAPSRIALGPTIGPTDPPRPARPVVWHESGHGVVIALAGGQVAEIIVAGQNPHVRHESALSPVVDAVMCIAGPAAQRRAEGFGRPDGAAEVAEGWRRVNRPGGGRCDFCNAMRAAIQRVGLDREAEAVALYRRAEALAHRIVWNEQVERCIRIAASELMRCGRMDGERFHEIAGEVIAPETIRYFKKELEQCWNS